MLQVTLNQAAALRNWFLPDRPGPLVGLHVLQTEHGACWVDRWPDPRVALLDCARNCTLIGDPGAAHLLGAKLAGFLDTSEPFVPFLHAAFPDMVVWDRVIFDLEAKPRFALPSAGSVRRLTTADIPHLHSLSPEVAWIGKTWGGLEGLAASGVAGGAFDAGRLAAVACTFFVGDRYEDIGIVTEPEFRGRGLGLACAAATCEAIQARGRRPSWTTSTDNTASIRVAEKLGFTLCRKDYSYVIGIPVPMPARKVSA